MKRPIHQSELLCRVHYSLQRAWIKPLIPNRAGLIHKPLCLLLTVLVLINEPIYYM